MPPNTKLSPKIRSAVTPSENISSDGANADINCTGNISMIIKPIRPIKAE